MDLDKLEKNTRERNIQEAEHIRNRLRKILGNDQSKKVSDTEHVQSLSQPQSFMDIVTDMCLRDIEQKIHYERDELLEVLYGDSVTFRALGYHCFILR